MVYKGSASLVEATLNIGTYPVREECKKDYCAAHNQRSLTAFNIRVTVKPSQLGGHVWVQLYSGRDRVTRFHRSLYVD